MSSQTRSLTPFTLTELRLCVRANQVACTTRTALFFALISRLGNGIFWWVFIASLPLFFGSGAILAILHLGATALASAVVYWSLKDLIRRPRPFRHHDGIEINVPPLDEFSFPSGHTLQAVSLSIVTVAWYPVLVWIVAPFSGLVALSRVVLGLHYPSDVGAAVVIGAVIGAISLGCYALV